MSANEWFCLVMKLSLFVLTLSCPDVLYRLRSNVTRQKGILCSTDMDDISTVNKTVNLLGKDGVIGIYKRSDSVGQLCYWKRVESGLVYLTNMTGGIFYAIGDTICPAPFVKSGVYCFNIMQTKQTVPLHTSACSATGPGGFLAKVESSEKDTVISNFIAGFPTIASQTIFIYIGLEDKVGDNDPSSYRWTVDDTSLTFENFDAYRLNASWKLCVGKITSTFRWHSANCLDATPGYGLCETQASFVQF